MQSQSSGKEIKILGCNDTLLDLRQRSLSGKEIKILGCNDTLLDLRQRSSSEKGIKILGCNVTLLCENCDTPPKNSCNLKEGVLL